MIQQMNFLGLVVKDVPTATSFYTDKLGLVVNETESIPNVYTQFELNGGVVMGLLTGFENEDIVQPFDAALMVDDVDATYANWQENGVDLLDQPRDMPFGRTFLFRTPDGHVLRVYAPSQSSN